MNEFNKKQVINEEDKNDSKNVIKYFKNLLGHKIIQTHYFYLKNKCRIK